MEQHNSQEGNPENLLSPEEITKQNREAFDYLKYLLDGHTTRLVLPELPKATLIVKDDGKIIELVAEYPERWVANDGITTTTHRISENGLEAISIRGELIIWDGLTFPIEIDKTIGVNKDLSESDIFEMDTIKPKTASMDLVERIKSSLEFGITLAKRWEIDLPKDSVAALVESGK